MFNFSIHLSFIIFLFNIFTNSFLFKHQKRVSIDSKLFWNYNDDVIADVITSDGNAPISYDSMGETKALTLQERLSRAVSFYSMAVPVFTSYKFLEESIKFKRNTLHLNISMEEEEAAYQKLHDWGSDAMVAKINELKGFYVKTGQIISTRVDIFPAQYTSKLAITLDGFDPMSVEDVKLVIRKELLGGAELSELFASFDDEPLGSASIAQVHKATLLDGRIVAVKVQRPGIDAKLLGDIKNLKNFAKIVGDSLPVDYYKIFCELERSFQFEVDFLHEAQSTHKIATAVAHSPINAPKKPAVIVPLPLTGLVSKRVLVMEFVDGIALSKLSVEMDKRGIKAGSIESKLFGKKLLSALTDAYGSMIFGSGIIHGDPHPGNIFITDTGEVALLDCGQVKQLSTARRLALAQLLVMINEWEKLDKLIKIELIKHPELKVSHSHNNSHSSSHSTNTPDKNNSNRNNNNSIINNNSHNANNDVHVSSGSGVIIKSIDDVSITVINANSKGMNTAVFATQVHKFSTASSSSHNSPTAAHTSSQSSALAAQSSSTAQSLITQAAQATLHTMQSQLNVLSSKITQYMDNNEIRLRDTANNECAVALALLLFGNSDSELPGGYSGAEISANSPIAQVISFPSDFILLGRATVMIKGIARRIGLDWGLCDIWSNYARQALNAKNDYESQPVWNVVEPLLASTNPGVSTNIRRMMATSSNSVNYERGNNSHRHNDHEKNNSNRNKVGGNVNTVASSSRSNSSTLFVFSSSPFSTTTVSSSSSSSSSAVTLSSKYKKIRFSEVMHSLGSWFQLLQLYLTRKCLALVEQYIPQNIRHYTFQKTIKLIAWFSHSKDSYLAKSKKASAI